MPDRIIKTMEFEVSSLCGAKCVFCPRDRDDYYYGLMSDEVFKKAIDEAANLGVIEIAFCAFGDALTDKNLEEKFKYIKTIYPQIKIGLTTTGQLLDEKRADFVCKYVDIFKLSIYGFSKEVYESVHRGSLVYEKVKENIDNYLNRKERPYTIATFLLLPQNKHEVDAWKEYYEPKVDQLDIWKVHNIGGYYDRNKIIEFGGEPTPLPEENKPTKPCFRVLELNNLVVRANGDVAMCCFYLGKGLLLGNINDESLHEIIENEKTKHIIDIHTNNKMLTSDIPCKDCDQIYDRKDSLVYTNDKTMGIGKLSHFHKD